MDRTQKLEIRVWVLFFWNLILTGALILLTFHYSDTSLNLEVLRVQQASINSNNSRVQVALTQLESRSIYIAREVDLLSDQCELTLDLLVGVDRSGYTHWWSDVTFRTLAELHSLKSKRRMLYELR